jgi:hypothetical protein
VETTTRADLSVSTICRREYVGLLTFFWSKKDGVVPGQYQRDQCCVHESGMEQGSEEASVWSWLGEYWRGSRHDGYVAVSVEERITT